MTDTESTAAQKPVKRVAVFAFLLVNVTWAFIAYMLHRVGLHLGLIATVVVFGAVLGNLTIFAAMRLATRMFRKSG